MNPVHCADAVPQVAPLGDKKRPPVGLAFEHRPDRPLPFRARWRNVEGVRESRSFASEADFWTFADSWEKKRRTFGKAAQTVAPRRLEVWNAFDELTGGADPLEVARWYVRHKGEVGGRLSLKDAVARFSVARGEAISGHMELHLGRLVASLGGRSLGSITPDDLRAWVASLRDRETGQNFGSVTLGHHVKNVRAFWNFCVREGLATRNVALAVEKPDDDDEGDVNVLEQHEAETLFAANRDALCVGRLALEAFGGLRFTSAARLRRDEILWDERGIVMPGSRHKSGRRHYVDGWPDNLWEWLKHAPDACWDLNLSNYARLKREAFERAGLKPPEPAKGARWTADELAQVERMRNVLRHSFASNHISAYKDTTRTLYLMTKRSIVSLNNDYRGRRTEAQGKAYFAITPTTARPPDGMQNSRQKSTRILSETP